MKNIAIGILLVAAVVFGGLYLQQTRQTRQAQAGADSLQQKAGELQASLDEQEKQKTRLHDQLEAARAAAAAQAPSEEVTNPAPPAAAGQTNAKPANPLAEMFKNPEMKEMIKNQQKTALGAMIDKNYARLFADLHLTPEQSAAVKDLILNKQLAAADMGMSMFTDDMDAAKRAELAQQIKTANEATDAQIKDLLGDDAYTQFQAYEKSMGERMAISGFTDQLGSGPMALAGDQEQQLLQTMTQVRQNFKFTTDYSDQSEFQRRFCLDVHRGQDERVLSGTRPVESAVPGAGAGHFIARPDRGLQKIPQQPVGDAKGRDANGGENVRPRQIRRGQG